MPRFLAFSLLLAGSTVFAGDWPQYRGPNRTGVSDETGLLKAWPKDGPKLLWTYKDAGLGFSGPAVVGTTLYTMGSRDDKTEVVIALDTKTGKEIWTSPVGPLFDFDSNSWGAGPRSTPTIDGKMLYALGAQGNLVCLDISGAQPKEVWRKSMLKDFKGEMMPKSDYNWGYSESPLVDGDRLLVTPGGSVGTVVALNKKTGDLIWQSKDQANRAPYSSMVVAEIQGVRQYIQTSYIDGLKGGVVSGYDAKTGKVLWSSSIFKGDSYAICPSPIVKGNQVYVTSGYGGGCHLFNIGKDFSVKDVYPSKYQRKIKNTHGGVVLIDGYIYGHTESRTWFCQDFETGETTWRNRDFRDDSGAITAAEGKLYLLGEEGQVLLVDVNPKEWKQISTFNLPEKSKYPESRTSSRSARVWTHPVIAHGRLYLRDCELIFCYDISGK